MNINTSFSCADYCYAILNKNLDIYYSSENIHTFFPINRGSDFSSYKKLFKDYIKNNKVQLTKMSTNSYNDIYFSLKEVDLYGKKTYILLAIDFSYYKILKNNINSLVEELHLNASILNSLQDGIFITDEKGEVTFVNDSFCTLSGLNYDDVVGYDVFYLLRENIVPNSCCAKVIETKMPVSTLNKYYTGKECLVTGTPIFNSKGELKKVVSTVRDLSELQNLMLELEKTTSLSKIYKNKIEELEAIHSNEQVITRSKEITEIYEMISNISSIDSTILILGETGVGKDFLANYIHNVSNRKSNGPFLKINCSAIPEHLLESELFGYEAGAFTGASRGGKIGLFELASNGTLFLDEIGDMPYNLQAKLLTVLQDKTMYRVGGNQTIDINARIIAATNADLQKLIEERKFRIDLYYRLNVISFTIPPLRERKEDIIPLANSFLKDFNSKYRKNRYFSSDAYETILNYDWPGNIREMKNLIERIVIMSKEDLIDSDLFYSQISGTRKSNISTSDSMHSFALNRTPDLKSNMERYEAFLIKDALSKCNTLQETADFLDITLSTLVRRKRKYNL